MEDRKPDREKFPTFPPRDNGVELLTKCYNDYYNSAYDRRGKLIKRLKGDFIVDRVTDSHGGYYFLTGNDHQDYDSSRWRKIKAYGIADSTLRIICRGFPDLVELDSTSGKRKYFFEFNGSGLLKLRQKLGFRRVDGTHYSDAYYLYNINDRKFISYRKYRDYYDKVDFYGKYAVCYASDYGSNDGVHLITTDGLIGQYQAEKVLNDSIVRLINYEEAVDLDYLNNKVSEPYKYRTYLTDYLYKISENGLYGIENRSGFEILPCEYRKIELAGKSNFQGDKERYIADGHGKVILATHATLGGRATGYGFYENFLTALNEFGNTVIPLSRGYNSIFPQISKGTYSRRPYIEGSRRSSGHKPYLWYTFYITTGGVEIMGLCDVHGQEIYRAPSPEDMYSHIDYNTDDGFFYINNLGKKIELNVFLKGNDSSEHHSWNDNICDEKPQWSIEYTLANTAKKWREDENGVLRYTHTESDGFQWVEVMDGTKSHAEDLWGNVIVPPSTNSCTISYAGNNYVRGMFFRRSLGEGFYTEVFTREGNPVIGKDRAYQSVTLRPDSKHFITQVGSLIGACDFNGYEVAPPRYTGFDYDGYVFEGDLSDGSVDRFNVHSRPISTSRKPKNQRKAHSQDITT